jgi:hypothetical protein
MEAFPPEAANDAAVTTAEACSPKKPKRPAEWARQLVLDVRPDGCPSISRPSYLVCSFIVVLMIVLTISTDSIEINIFSTMKSSSGLTVKQASSSPRERGGSSASGPHSTEPGPQQPNLAETPTDDSLLGPSALQDMIESGYKQPLAFYDAVYQRRGQPRNETDLEQMGARWGSWAFVDQKASIRPDQRSDYFAAYDHRDIPWSEFPSDAWQKDTEYLQEFLPAAHDLVTRAMEAILGEYGHSRFDEPERSFEERSEMFSVWYINAEGGEKPPRKGIDVGGWSTERSMTSLRRRLLHALVTQDTWTIVMGTFLNRS